MADNAKRKRIIPAAQAYNKDKQAANHQLRLWAYNMRLSGFTYEQIGQQCDRHKTTIRKWVHQHMETLERDKVEQIRDLEIARLDKLQAAIDHTLGAVMDADALMPLKTRVDMLAKLTHQQRSTQESRRKLLGLDAAEKVHIEIEEKSQAEINLDKLLKQADQRVRAEEARLKEHDGSEAAEGE